jgi:hypothetical protein
VPYVVFIRPMLVNINTKSLWNVSTYLCHTKFSTKSLQNVFVTSVGGMYNTAVEVGKKRKRFSCFACDSEIRHPDNGFVAGHLLAS